MPQKGKNSTPLQRNVPTIGVVERLEGEGFENSGAIIVMMDSDCISQQRQIRSCNFLFEQFVDIATRDTVQEAENKVQDKNTSETKEENQTEE